MIGGGKKGRGGGGGAVAHLVERENSRHDIMCSISALAARFLPAKQGYFEISMLPRPGRRFGWRQNNVTSSDKIIVFPLSVCDSTYMSDVSLGVHPLDSSVADDGR